MCESSKSGEMSIYVSASKSLMNQIKQTVSYDKSPAGIRQILSY